jgi:transposase
MAHHGKKVSQMGISKILKKYRTTGSTSRHPGSGRKRVSSSRDDRHLKRVALSNRKQTLRHLSTAYRTSAGRQLSKQTISRRLREQGLRIYRCRRVPLLSILNKAKRREWAVRHRDKPAAFWAKVLWSDESRFCLISDRPEKCIRRKGEDYHPECVSARVQNSAGLMVWSCFSASGLGQLYRLPRGKTLDSAAYQHVMSTTLLPTIQQLHLGGECLFMQDNAPCHRAKATMKWFADHNIDVITDWPPYSPDINPIENLWDYCERKLKNECVNDVEELWLHLQKIWSEVPEELIRSLVSSIPQRLKEVLKNGGGSTHY